MEKILGINQVVIEKKLYPRLKIDWVTQARYLNALKSGAIFPAICVAEVGKFKKKYVLIDGAHRLSAYKANKEKHITAEVLTGLSDNQIYLEAVKRNIGHGRQFSTQEVTQICLTLQDWNISKEEIQAIVRIPSDKLQSFVATRMTRIMDSKHPQGRYFALKAPLKALAGSEQTGEFENEQDLITGTSQDAILDTMISFLENDWVNMENPIIKGKVNKIYKLLTILLNK